MAKFKPGCTCKRHSRVLTEEHRQKIIERNKSGAGVSKGKCAPDCTCKRHQGYYFGGSKPGRKFSEQAIANIAKSAQNRQKSWKNLDT